MKTTIGRICTILCLSIMISCVSPLCGQCAEVTKLTRENGTVYGPSGKETYYNLNMNEIVNIMRGMGFDEDEYPYWIREDGVKMLGDYVMVAADLNIRPRGCVVATTLGKALVCDTGSFTNTNSRQIDIAVAW